MLNPGHYDAVRRPVSVAETLPPWCYTSDEFYRHEVERLFLGSWHCVGRKDRLSSPGDYAAVNIAGVPVLLVKGADGETRAYSNTCRHRGTQLLQGEGSCDLIRCPLHGWAYRLDGTLAGAPQMNQAEGFSMSDYSLTPVPLSEHSSFVFVNISGNATSLWKHMGDFGAVHERYALDDMVTTWSKEYRVACNWKLFVQVFMEYYHLRTVHGETFAATDYQPPDPPVIETGEYISVFGEHAGNGALLEEDWDKCFPSIDSLSDREVNGSRYTHIYPSTIFCATKDCMWFYECYPQGPAESVFVLNACFPKSTAQQSGFAERAQRYYERWDIALQEDITVLELQQKGMQSPLCKPGRFSHLEYAVGYFERWLTEQLVDKAD